MGSFSRRFLTPPAQRSRRWYAGVLCSRAHLAPKWAKAAESTTVSNCAKADTSELAPATMAVVTGFSLERRFCWASPERLRQRVKPKARPSSCLPSVSSSRDCFSFGLSPRCPPKSADAAMRPVRNRSFPELNNPFHPCRRLASPECQNPSSAFRRPSLPLSPRGQQPNSRPVRRL